jgi:hypothetical protein
LFTKFETMEKHIRLQGYTKPAAQVNELTLTLTDLSSTSFEALKAYHVLEELRILTCKVKSLETFPSLPLLKVLDLCENEISSLAPLANLQLKNLETLDISVNCISSFDELKHLAKFPSIKSIKIDGNPIADEADTREKLFALLPKLESIDDVDREGNRVDGASSSSSSASEGEKSESSSESGSGSGSGSGSDSGSADDSESGSEESEEELGTRTLLQDDYESDSEEGDFVPDAAQANASGSESGSDSESAAEDEDESGSESGSGSGESGSSSGSEESSEDEEGSDEGSEEASGSDEDAVPAKKQKL